MRRAEVLEWCATKCYTLVTSGCDQILDLAEKYCQGQNTLAYLAPSSVTKQKSFIRLPPGTLTTKLVAVVIDEAVAPIFTLV